MDYVAFGFDNVLKETAGRYEARPVEESANAKSLFGRYSDSCFVVHGGARK